MKKIKYLIWGIFITTTILFLVAGFGRFFGFNIEDISKLHNIALLLPFVGVILHSIYILGLKRALLFMFLSSGVGFISEYLGVHYGLVFGAGYEYFLEGPLLFSVPVLVLSYWFVFIYTGFMFTTTLIKKKLNIFTKSLIDAYFVLSIDLFMEPMQVQMGNWVWHKNGLYFGIPISNFIGWYIVAFTSTFIFRLLTKDLKISLSKNLITKLPVYGYVLIWISLFTYMISTGNYLIAVVGSIFMLPAVLILLQ